MTRWTAEALARIIDHTNLRPDATEADIRLLCDDAIELGCGAVCVNPCRVALAVSRLDRAAVRVCSVAGFPLGANIAATKLAEAQMALAEGAHEIDVVINLGHLKSGHGAAVSDELAAIARACRDAGALSKAILEMAALTQDEKVTACRLAVAAGVDFVKTSTGFGPGGATVADVTLMRATVGPGVGIKASGGIRTIAFAEALLAAGATRLGTSATRQLLGR
jgi:deoxyribose-phosphate aldolase